MEVISYFLILIIFDKINNQRYKIMIVKKR